jgi:serine/threonine-protein kinase
MSGTTEVERLRRADEIVQRALACGDGELAALLDEACAGDARLRAEVDSLLGYRERARDFIETPAYALGAGLFDDGDSGRVAGRRIGPYVIVREIGRGGMGTVFLAERADGEFRQQVALKVVRRSFADTELARRFRQERQILASLNHPNIARLLDGGVSADGEPYLVMEYVEGERIDEYCERAALSVRARLGLFLEVCRAVSYAHRHLVVHRDIKPSNILVAEDAETRKPAPKLLDFGIAKLLDAEQAGDETRTGMRAFTPDYAAPEQVAAGGQITTATDVYSLGVLLGDLLSGARRAAEARKSPGAWRSRSRGATVATNLPTEGLGAKERTGPHRAAGAELENIVSMARREDPARRYASAAELADDVERYLEGRTVRAQKDSFAYRAGKFVRRNRAGVAAAAAVVLSLVVGLGVAVWQAKAAARERDRARVEAAKAERINAFMQHVLGFSDISWTSTNPTRNPNATIDEALDEASRRVEAELSDQPEVSAAVHLAIGRDYAGRSRFDAAELHLRAALDLRQKVLGPEHQDTAEAMTALSELLIQRGNYPEAESFANEAVAIYRKARASGDVNLIMFTIALNDQGLARSDLARPADAEVSLREAIEVGSKLTGKERYVYGTAYHNLAGARRAQGDLDGAIANEEKAIEVFRQLSVRSTFDMGLSHANLAYYVMMKGDYARSESLFLEALSIYRESVGDTHINVSHALINLADNYYDQGKYQQAREAIDHAIKIQKQLLPEGNAQFGLSYFVLGKILTRTGDTRGGEDYLRRALDTQTKNLPKGHRWAAYTQSALGENLTAQKRYAEAEPLLVESYNTLNAALGPQDPKTREARRRLGALYLSWGRPEEAARYDAQE